MTIRVRDIEGLFDEADELIQHGHFSGPGDLIDWLQSRFGDMAAGDVVAKVRPELRSFPAYSCYDPDTEWAILMRWSGYVVTVTELDGTEHLLMLDDPVTGPDDRLAIRGRRFDERTGNATEERVEISTANVWEVYAW